MLTLTAWTLIACAAGYLAATRASRFHQPPPLPAVVEPAPCPDCGHAHGPDLDAEAVATALADLLNPVLLTVGDQPPGLPAAAIITVPAPGGRAAVRLVMHPDAYPDAADFADQLEALAAHIRRNQGQINHDSHQLRQNGAPQ